MCATTSRITVRCGRSFVPAERSSPIRSAAYGALRRTRHGDCYRNAWWRVAQSQSASGAPAAPSRPPPQRGAPGQPDPLRVVAPGRGPSDLDPFEDPSQNGSTPGQAHLVPAVGDIIGVERRQSEHSEPVAQVLAPRGQAFPRRVPLPPADLSPPPAPGELGELGVDRLKLRAEPGHHGRFHSGQELAGGRVGEGGEQGLDHMALQAVAHDGHTHPSHPRVAEVDDNHSA
jgi:hypothetical protein